MFESKKCESGETEVEENLGVFYSDSQSCHSSSEDDYEETIPLKIAPMKPDIGAFPKDSLHFAVATGDTAKVRAILRLEFEELHARYKGEVQRFKTRTMQIFAKKDLPSETIEMQRLKRKLQFDIEKKWRGVLARRDLCGRSLLHLAAASSCFTVFKVLYDSKGVSPTSTCFYRGKRRPLYRDDASYNFDSGDEVSRYASSSVTLKSIRCSQRALLQLVDENGHPPMDYAITAGNRSVAKYISRHSIGYRSVTKIIGQAASRPASSGKATASIVGSVDDRNGWNALHHVVFERGSPLDQMKHVKAILEQDVKVDSKTNRGRTALHLAALSEYSNTAVVKYLAINGADLDATDQDGNSPLMLAASRNRHDVVELLASKGANLFTCNKQGYNALHTAARNNHAACVRLLVQLDSDVRKLKHELTPKGYTAQELGRLPEDLFKSTWETAEAGDLKRLHKELSNVDVNVATWRSSQSELTLLHSAVLGCGRQPRYCRKIEPTLRYLLDHWPAMVLVRDRHERTPEDLAIKCRGPQWVLDLLQDCAVDLDIEAGADIEEKAYETESADEDELQEIADKHFGSRSLRKSAQARPEASRNTTPLWKHSSTN